MKKPIFLISTAGKSLEQMKEEARATINKFKAKIKKTKEESEEEYEIVFFKKWVAEDSKLEIKNHDK